MSSKQHELITFFLDENLSSTIITTALRDNGEAVEIHSDHFNPGTSDEEWLTEVGKKGWVVFTKDTRIRYRVTEKHALLAAGVKAFVLSCRSSMTGQEMADAFIKALPKIKQFAKNKKSPFIAKVTRYGKVQMIEN